MELYCNESGTESATQAPAGLQAASGRRGGPGADVVDPAGEGGGFRRIQKAALIVVLSEAGRRANGGLGRLEAGRERRAHSPRDARGSPDDCAGPGEPRQPGSGTGPAAVKPPRHIARCKPQPAP